jgi:hypothetical protein
MHLVVIGDRRKAHDLPGFPGQHVAREIVFVQPVHDHYDGTPRLVVEPAVERVVVPRAGVRQRLLGLRRVVDVDQVGAAPGQVAADRGGDAAAPRRRLELGDTTGSRRRAGNRATICRQVRAPGLRLRRTFGIITRG